MESTDGELPIFETNFLQRKIRKRRIRVEKASRNDVEGILKVAASVGKNEKDSYKGFLMDDYGAKPEEFTKFFSKMVDSLDYFYVAKDKETVGFLMAYTKEQWLAANPEWMDAVNWSPEFEFEKTGNFVIVDKIAIMEGHTGKGVGSAMYGRFISELKVAGIEGIFSETIIYPIPNFASLSFRKKQGYMLAGTRYEEYKGMTLMDAIYYKPVK